MSASSLCPQPTHRNNPPCRFVLSVNPHNGQVMEVLYGLTRKTWKPSKRPKLSSLIVISSPILEFVKHIAIFLLYFLSNFFHSFNDNIYPVSKSKVDSPNSLKNNFLILTCLKTSYLFHLNHAKSFPRVP